VAVFPVDADDGVTVVFEKSVSDIRLRPRGIDGRVVQPVGDRVAAVLNVEEQDAIARRWLLRCQDLEFAAVFDAPVGAPGGLGEIGNRSRFAMPSHRPHRSVSRLEKTIGNQAVDA
jgi:hypothetical protein